MALTKAEAAKLIQDLLVRRVIETIAKGSSLVRRTKATVGGVADGRFCCRALGMPAG